MKVSRDHGDVGTDYIIKSNVHCFVCSWNNC